MPPSSKSMPAVPTRSTTRAVDLSLKRQIALPEIAVMAPTCAGQQHLILMRHSRTNLITGAAAATPVRACQNACTGDWHVYIAAKALSAA